MFFIVWGSRGRNKEIGAGEFYCPDCGDYRAYKKIAVTRWFTLYWIPLFPMGKPVGEYVECGACKSTFNERVLEMDPKAAAEKFEAAFSIAAKRVMFKMALADGEIDQSEIDTITQAFANIAKREIDPADIAAELEAAKSDTRPVAEYLRGVAAGMNDTGKELVLRSAIAVAKADGHIDDTEVVEMHELAFALDFPKAYANGIFMEEGIQPITKQRG
ncbi:Tellurite resistance protein [Octadecabacter temperatus]|uniref:Tellurite resistance protein TerB n=1 Tax=Octadecabacter temperatus TaxID=1458307 RepID=A0A0K0Y1I3_9RHOB|nr:TerB family tellurite resistance protein [Octadecabacter temperatus]AKS44741.1 Tellurite resistance protein TerB [Octadecabacter temperatus]SIO35801.1 Tellurite resistance protein [Octadecabacter temperatus]